MDMDTRLDNKGDDLVVTGTDFDAIGEDVGNAKIAETVRGIFPSEVREADVNGTEPDVRGSSSEGSRCETVQGVGIHHL
jgi:hypothetical protein